MPTPVNGVDIGDLDGDGYADIVLGADDDGDAGQMYYVSGWYAPSWAVVNLLDTSADESGTDNPGVAVPRLYDWDGDGWLDLMTVEENDPFDTTAKVLNLRLGGPGFAFGAATEVLGEGSVSGYVFGVPAF